MLPLSIDCTVFQKFIVNIKIPVTKYIITKPIAIIANIKFIYFDFSSLGAIIALNLAIFSYLALNFSGSFFRAKFFLTCQTTRRVKTQKKIPFELFII